MNLMCLLGRHVWQYSSRERRMCVMCYIHEVLRHNEWVRG